MCVWINISAGPARALGTFRNASCLSQIVEGVDGDGGLRHEVEVAPQQLHVFLRSRDVDRSDGEKEARPSDTWHRAAVFRKKLGSMSLANGSLAEVELDSVEA